MTDLEIFDKWHKSTIAKYSITENWQVGALIEFAKMYHKEQLTTQRVVFNEATVNKEIVDLTPKPLWEAYNNPFKSEVELVCDCQDPENGYKSMTCKIHNDEELYIGEQTN